ncbi:MAG: hypothetical protein IKI08_03080 [Selenomonadaceae bacterium]|nr:hypothetical protein [Selenomonadaceae bacterium]
MATTDERLNTLEQQFAVTMTKVDSALAELKEQREDMRRLWERQDAERAQRDADIRELHKRQEAAQEKHEADMHEMNERFYGKIDDLSKQINDTWKQTMIGVGGMIIALGALIIGALK